MKDHDFLQEALDLLWGRHSGQTQLAEHLGQSDRTVRYWIAGEKPIPEYVWKSLIVVAEHKMKMLKKFLKVRK